MAQNLYLHKCVATRIEDFFGNSNKNKQFLVSVFVVKLYDKSFSLHHLRVFECLIILASFRTAAVMGTQRKIQVGFRNKHKPYLEGQTIWLCFDQLIEQHDHLEDNVARPVLIFQTLFIIGFQSWYWNLESFTIFMKSPRHWNTRILKHQDTDTPGHWNTRILKHKDTETPGHWNTRTLKHKYTETPRKWNTRILKHQDTETL